MSSLGYHFEDERSDCDDDDKEVEEEGGGGEKHTLAGKHTNVTSLK